MKTLCKVLYDYVMENNIKYIVYVDESNISSESGHSIYGAIFVYYCGKDFLSNKLLNIENNLKISYTHWSEMPWKLRIIYAERINCLDFICKIFVYNNPIIQYKVLEEFLLKILNTEDLVIKIIIDGKQGKRSEEKLRKILKINGFALNNLKFVDDKKEVMLRLADFMAGMYRSYLDNENIHNKYIFNLLKQKIKTLN